MSNTGNNAEGWIDGVGVGSNPEAAPKEGPEPEQGAATEETEHQPTPPRGVPAAGASAPGPSAGGKPPGPETHESTTAARATTSPLGAATETLAPTILPSGPAARQQRGRWPIFVLAVLVLIGIFLVVHFAFLAGAPAYKVVVYGKHPTSMRPREVAVGFAVKNTGTATGTPTCTVRVASVTGAGKGTFTEKPLDPGKGAIFINWVKVTTATKTMPASTWTIEAITCT